MLQRLTYEDIVKVIPSTITSKGQVTIPVEVRRLFGIGKGGQLSFVVEGRRQVRLEFPKYSDLASLRGAAGKLPKPLSLRKMQKIAREDRFATKPFKK